MPIYEFYCRDCHRVYNFFSARIDTEARPNCPRCGSEELPRRPSRFATLKHTGSGAAGGDADDPFAGLDESRLEGAMESLMAEAGGADEEDPRAMARMMRRFSDLAGLRLGDRMEEMMARLEAGADPEELEAEMEGLEDGGDPEGGGMDDLFQLKAAMERRRRPPVDDELYFL